MEPEVEEDGLGELEEKDEFDLLLEEAEGEDADATRKRRRAPGMEDEPKAAPKRRVAGKSKSVPLAPASEQGQQDDERVSITASSMRSKEARTLDSEMQVVASKHSGSSTKCLEDFNPKTFLVVTGDNQTRYPLSAKIRGVRFPVCWVAALLVTLVTGVRQQARLG